MELRIKIFYSLLLVTVWKISELKGDEQIYDESSDTESDEPELIVEANKILKTLDEEASLLHNEDVIVVLGTAKSGKSLLVQFITGDNDKLISNSSDGKSWEILNSDLTRIQEPSLSDLLNIDIATGIPYYEFPAVGKDETFLDDLTSKYYTWRIINQAKSLKFILTVSYSSDDNNIIDLKEFLYLVKHTINFIKNVEKFSNSIALVITNLENPHNLELSVLRNKIADNLLYASKLFAQKGDKKGERLVADLLTHNGNEKYNKIGILTRPVAEGAVSKMHSLQHEKQILKSMIKNVIRFASKNNSDFNYALPLDEKTSEEDKKLIDALVDQIENRINVSRHKINNEILKYFQNREQNFNDIQELKKYFKFTSITFAKLQKSAEISGHVDNNHLNINHDKKILRHMVKRIRDLKMDVSEQNFINILHFYRYLEFTEAYSNRSIWSILQNWEMEEVTKFVEDSEKWYIFLNDLYSFFSDFEVQIRRDNYIMNIKEIDDVCTDKNLVNLEEGLIRFIKSHGLDESKIKKAYKSYEKIKNVNINKIKLERLCKIYKMTLLEELQMNCLDSTLQIKREFIRFDQIPPSTYCLGGIKRLELFALDTVFLNTDLNRIGEELEVVVIAPKWIVYGERKIVLDGMPGQLHEFPKAPDSYTAGFDGEDGQPGFPGRPAGSFLGIGTEIFGINKHSNRVDSIVSQESTLIISANGGNGGKGQDGGNGAKGEDGVKGMTELKSRYTRESEYNDIPRELTDCGFEGQPKGKYFCLYNIGTKGHPNGEGGNGGKGGLPGPAGSIHLFLPENTHGVHLKKYNESGITGQGGIGGQGGNGSMDGVTVYGIYTKWERPSAGRWKYHLYYNKINETEAPRVVLQKGNDGLPNNNTEGIKNAKSAKPTQFPQSVNKYKHFLRERIKEGMKWNQLMNFYGRLNDEGPFAEGKKISNLDDTLGLVDELQGLEEQFFKLHNQLNFLPFYQSLIRRVQVYAQNPKPSENNNEYKKVLVHLYTAIFSKICSLRDETSNSLIIDIRKYLVSVSENIQEIINAINEMRRNKFNKNFKADIDNKISEANQFAKVIEAEVHRINKQMDMELKTLTNITIAQKSIAENRLNNDKKKKEAAETRLVLHGVFEVLKGVALLASFCGPWGAIVGGILETGLNYAEPFVLDSLTREATKDQVIQNSGELLLTARSHIVTITDLLWKSQRDIVKKNINDLKNKVRKLPDLSKTKEKLEEVLEKTDPLSDKSVLDESQKVITEEEENLNNALKEQRESQVAQEEKREVLEYLKNLEKVNRIVKSGYRISKDIKTDKAEVDRIQADIEADEGKVQKLDDFQDDIREMIMPMLRSMRQEIDNVEKSLGSKSHVALDVTKWQVQQTLTNIKVRLKSMTRDFPQVSEYFGSLVQKLIETFNTLINIYDQIQHYQDRKVLMDYIAEINSPSMKDLHVDDKLNYAFSYLKVVLDTNAILGPYQRTINAFKQYTFPFAQFYMAEFGLPAELDLTSTKNIRSIAIYQMKRFMKNIDKTAVSVIPGMDEYIHEGEFSTESEFSGAFFVWKNSEHKLKIGELLSGKEIILNANIEEGLQENAVKFKTIELQFRAINPKLQKDLDKDLKKYQVTMTHMGNSYYRCGGKYYIITSNEQTFSYTFQKNSDSSNPKQTSLSYSKLQHGDFVLSPYAFWRIQLKKNSDFPFNELYKYTHQVDITLAGYGQYVDTEVNVCDSDLSKYYKEESSISTLDTIYDCEAQEYLEN